MEQRQAWAQQGQSLFAFLFDVADVLDLADGADVAALDSRDQRPLDDEAPQYALHVASLPLH